MTLKTKYMAGRIEGQIPTMGRIDPRYPNVYDSPEEAIEAYERLIKPVFGYPPDVVYTMTPSLIVYETKTTTTLKLIPVKE
jgi:hypothetical protein